MRTAVFLLLVGIGSTGFGQFSAKYDSLTSEAFSLYKAKDFAGSAKLYSSAFESAGWGATMDDLYNAACSWALANGPDSALYQLFRISEKADHHDLEHLTMDPDLTSLHADPRWPRLVALVSANQEKAEPNIDRPLAHMLDSIMEEDQRYRRQIRDVENQYGRGSEEMKDLFRKMSAGDSANLILVKRVLDTRGWLGPDSVGEDGSDALFIVVQHADQATQERYLPMMRAAVAKGNAEPADLALLEDRVALGEGKRQIYGSQIGRDPDTGEFYVSPLEDPDHVDERRRAVGLEPLADYVSNWDIIWDVKAYKADLPALEARERARK